MTKSKKLQGERKQNETMLVLDDSIEIDEKLYSIENIRRCSRWCSRVIVLGSPWPTKNFFLRERSNEQ